MADDVVFAFFGVDWRNSRRRGSRFAQDRLFERLLSDERIGHLVVANPFRSVASVVARGPLGRPERRGRRVTMVSPPRLRRSDPVHVDTLRRTYARYDRVLARAAGRAGAERPAVVTSNPFAAGLCEFEWARSVTYYATDDWPAHHGYRPWRAALEVAQSEIAARGRRVCAVSSVITDRMQPTGAATVVPNGVSRAEWSGIAPAPGWFGELPGPRLLYAGTLDGRIDVDLVRQTAAQVPGASIVLVGSPADPAHLERLKAVPGVVVRPPVGRQELVSLVGASDACLLPHAITPLTEAMSPLKVYEYLAGGRPVAAVDLPPVRGIDDRVVLADPAVFGSAVSRALELGPATEAHRLAFVEANSWDRRHEQILDFALA